MYVFEVCLLNRNEQSLEFGSGLTGTGSDLKEKPEKHIRLLKKC